MALVAVEDILPNGAKPLTESGYFYVIQARHQGRDAIMLRALSGSNEGRYARIEVAIILDPVRVPSPYYPERESLFLISVLPSPGRIGATTARMISEVIVHASEECGRLNKEQEPLLAAVRQQRAEREADLARQRVEQEQRYAEQQAEWKRLREERAEQIQKMQEREEQRAKELHEHVKWLLEHQFRLRRKGKKSTVYGTIKSVSEPEKDWRDKNIPDAPVKYRNTYMTTVSEKDLPMTIELKDVIAMEVKYDGEKRYTKIYESREAAGSNA